MTFLLLRCGHGRRRCNEDEKLSENPCGTKRTQKKSKTPSRGLDKRAALSLKPQRRENRTQGEAEVQELTPALLNSAQ